MSAPAALALGWLGACRSARPAAVFSSAITGEKSFRPKPPPLSTLSASFCAALMSMYLHLLDQGAMSPCRHTAHVALGVEDFQAIDLL